MPTFTTIIEKPVDLNKLVNEVKLIDEASKVIERSMENSSVRLSIVFSSTEKPRLFVYKMISMKLDFRVVT